MVGQGGDGRLPPLGLLPAAGRGRRFGAAGYIKELFPLLPPVEDVAGPLLGPRPICERALRLFRAAGARQCTVVLSPQKLEVVEVLSAAGHIGLDLAYVIQNEPHGLPHAIRCARPWLAGRDVLLALPDTIILPTQALAEVHRERLQSGADLVLGVFPVSHPERLGPVEIDASGDVLRILDKPAKSPVKNSWGVASWSWRFTEFCADWDLRAEAEGPRERVLGHAFEAARQSGLRVRAVFFADGLMLDIGTPDGLRATLRALAALGDLDPAQAGVTEPGQAVAPPAHDKSTP